MKAEKNEEGLNFVGRRVERGMAEAGLKEEDALYTNRIRHMIEALDPIIIALDPIIKAFLERDDNYDDELAP